MVSGGILCNMCKHGELSHTQIPCVTLNMDNNSFSIIEMALVSTYNFAICNMLGTEQRTPHDFLIFISQLYNSKYIP